jgi:hypothetical protein
MDRRLPVFHKVLMPDGKKVASREAWMMMHPGCDQADYFPGDLVELEEGIFVLNDDLNPMQLASAEQIAEGLEDEPDLCVDFDGFVTQQQPKKLSEGNDFTWLKENHL